MWLIAIAAIRIRNWQQFRGWPASVFTLTALFAGYFSWSIAWNRGPIFPPFPVTRANRWNYPTLLEAVWLILLPVALLRLPLPRRRLRRRCTRSIGTQPPRSGWSKYSASAPQPRKPSPRSPQMRAALAASPNLKSKKSGPTWRSAHRRTRRRKQLSFRGRTASGRPHESALTISAKSLVLNAGFGPPIFIVPECWKHPDPLPFIWLV